MIEYLLQPTSRLGKHLHGGRPRLVWVDERTIQDDEDFPGFRRFMRSYSLEVREPIASRMNYKLVFYPGGRWYVSRHPDDRTISEHYASGISGWNRPDFRHFVEGTMGKGGRLRVDPGPLEMDEFNLLEAMAARYLELATNLQATG